MNYLHLEQVLEPATRLATYNAHARWVDIPPADNYANDAWDEAIDKAVPRLCAALSRLPGARRPADLAGAGSAKNAYSDFWERVGYQAADPAEAAEALASSGQDAAAAALVALQKGIKARQAWPYWAVDKAAWAGFIVRMKAEAAQVARLAGQQRALM